MSLGQCNPQQKILWHLDRVVEWQKTGKTSPIIFEIDPSNRCNQDCPWCSFSKLRSESQAVMCLETIKSLLDNLKEMGVKAVNWTGGGEPLVNTATLDAVIYAKSLGFDQGIFTNGLLLNEKARSVLLKSLTWLRVSLDGYDEESYAKSHGTSIKSFNIVLNNIRQAALEKDRCTLGVGFIITPENYHGIEKVAYLAKDLGVDYIQFKPAIYRPGSKQMGIDLIEDEILPLLNRVKLLSNDKFNVMVTHYRFNDVMDVKGNYGRNYKKCLSHHFQGAVGADAKVYICDHHKGEKEYVLGDLTKNTMQEIWDSEQRKEVIKYLDSTDLSQCQSCCRNHELNKFLWVSQNPQISMHPNHI